MRAFGARLRMEGTIFANAAVVPSLASCLAVRSCAHTIASPTNAYSGM